MIGRQEELRELESLLEINKASLVVIMGRRRIGKSTLAKKFASRNFKNILDFAGLAPRPKQTNQHQLDHFASQLMQQLDLKGLSFTDWNDVFLTLNQLTKNKKFFILFDEISWMGALDPDFPGKLKIAWDNFFSKNKNLVLILCGSVSSWVEDNILFRADFVGRISLELRLKELPLNEVKHFWFKRNKRLSSRELSNVLMVAGCVPRYLEEFRLTASSEQEISRLCFRRSGFLFNEYDKIFHELFGKKTDTYRHLVEILIDGPLSAKGISKKLKVPLNKDLSRHLYVLEISGFLTREYSYSKEFKKTKLSRYRLSDNYLRFYLKYIHPRKDQIELDTFSIQSVQQLPEWSIASGFFFENLILNHRTEIIDKLEIPKEFVISASPYIQSKKTRNKGACQIDLLIQTKKKMVYVCEIKNREVIDKSVIHEVETKMNKLERARGVSIRPVLIYQGQLKDEYLLREFFDKILSIEKLLDL